MSSGTELILEYLLVKVLQLSLFVEDLCLLCVAGALVVVVILPLSLYVSLARRHCGSLHCTMKTGPGGPGVRSPCA
jgi:hypothetical protein